MSESDLAFRAVGAAGRHLLIDAGGLTEILVLNHHLADLDLARDFIF